MQSGVAVNSPLMILYSPDRTVPTRPALPIKGFPADC